MTLLEVRDLDVHHGQLRAVTGFRITVAPGQKVGVIGANGAGKSTLLRCIAGILRASTGSIEIDGTDVVRLPAHKRVDHGIALVPEGRRLFKSLSVEENLLTGSYRGKEGPWSLDAVFDLFPWMPDRRKQNSAQLSGGEQQSVAIGRALMTNPRLLLIDELSLGLAPVIVKRIYEALPRIVENGCSILLVEQDVSQALAVADQVHCLLEGRTVLSGKPSELAMKDVEAAYFGIDATPKAG
jgi:branched-chain amino acid transport system ATP-binding protein